MVGVARIRPPDRRTLRLPSLAATYSRMEPYGFMLIILLLATGALDVVMRPLIALVLGFLRALVGI